MSYNAIAIAFHAAALHIINPRENLLEECVDDLATKNKFPVGAYDYLEDLAENVRDFLLDSDDMPCTKALGDLLNPEQNTPIMQCIRDKHDEFVGSLKTVLSEIAFEDGNDEDDEEAAELQDTIDITSPLLDKLKSNLTDDEIGELINVALEVDDIAKSQPLNLYYSRHNAHPALASE